MELNIQLQLINQSSMVLAVEGKEPSKKHRVIGAVVSFLLIVAVSGYLIGGSGSKHDSNDKNADISTTSKSVAAICQPTDYKEVCFRSLGSLAFNGSANPKDLIQAAIQATIETVQEAKNKSGSMFDNQTQKMAKDDCDDLLGYAVQELQSSYSLVGDNEMHSMNDRVAELKNWLSAVISYQQTCLDGVTDKDLNKRISTEILLNATQMTSNALAIVSSLSEIWNLFNLTSSEKNRRSQRLLDFNRENSKRSEYPGWFSVSDRKLLTRRGNIEVIPNAVVAKDGSGQYTTIAAALAAYPKNLKGRYVIYIKTGIYDEHITVTKDQTNVFMYGDGPRETIVTGKKSFRDGVSTYRTATFCKLKLNSQFN